MRLSGREDVLEVGFGGGALLDQILGATSGRVFGVDVSHAVLARARRRFIAQLRTGRLALARASADALPLSDQSVDRACAVETIYFWHDPVAALAELARVLRTGGRLVIGLEPPEELRRWPGHVFGLRLYEVGEVARMMERAGFCEVREAWGTGRKPDRFCCLSARRRDANG